MENVTRLWKRLLSNNLAVALALVGLIGLFRPDWFYEKRADLVIEVSTNSDLLSVRTPLAKLRVYFDTRELTSSAETIRLITFKVRNVGNDAIKLGDFDPKYPLGVQIKGGELIEIPTLVPSNAYQKSIDIVTSRTPTSLTFGPMILDQGEYFTIGMLVLAKVDAKVTMEPFGKVAGINKIRQIDETEIQKETFVSKVISGDWHIQIGRMTVYFIATFLFILAIIAVVELPYSVIDNFNAKRNRSIRKEQINTFIKANQLTPDPIYSFIFNLYLNQPMRMSNSYDALRFAINNGHNLLGLSDKFNEEIVKPLSQKQGHVEDTGWNYYGEIGGLVLFVGSALEKLFEENTKNIETVESLKSKFMAFDSYLKNEGIPLQPRVDRMSSFFYFGDKYRKEHFAWM